ncbi:MAG: endopeptidase La, partial [Bacteroidetes bacterium]
MTEMIKPEAGLVLPSRTLPPQLLVLPVSERPYFPGIPFPLLLSDPVQVERVRQAVEQENGYVAVVLEKETETGEGPPDLYPVGTAARIFRVLESEEGIVQILAQGQSRCQLVRVMAEEPHLRWQVTYHHDPETTDSPDLQAYTMAVAEKVRELLSLNPVFQEQLKMIAPQLSYERPGLMMDIVAAMLPLQAAQAQDLLARFDLEARARRLLELLQEQIQLARLQQKINEQINTRMSEQQKEFFLREQLKAIKQELGMEKDDQTATFEQYEKRLAELDLHPEARKVVEEELAKLKVLDPRSPEFNVSRSWLDLITDLPWGKFSEDQTDINRAEAILEKDHYGLREVKDLILEFLSTLIKRGQLTGSIILLVGPPGVGKTSIGRSIAHALGREFFRFSLGGMRDEAEIKGHRRTYIGAMPGKFITALRRAGTANPVILLDEIDKLGASFRGDPASALLEVLDPEQNLNFRDHYLDVPFDLSKVLFVATANQLDSIPGPLLDRMEVIRLPGYILEEKVQIARQYLVPKQLREAGFAEGDIRFQEKALAQIVDQYAREAGVRNLEKQIRKIIRKLTLLEAKGRKLPKTVTTRQIGTYLGRPLFNTERLYPEAIPGLALGLAYTSMGGATLYIEATAIPGQSGMQLTGQLGDVMRESAQIAYSYVQTLVQTPSGDEKSFFDRHRVHLHVPAGATPKDGPSAGITMTTALLSMILDKPT